MALEQNTKDFDSIKREALKIAAKEADQFRFELRRAASPADFERLGGDHQRRVEMLFKSKLAESGDRIDCKAGCSLCCHLKIDVYPLDIFVLVGFVKRKLRKEQVDAIHARAKANRLRINGLSADDQMDAHIPCPLLQNDLCICYDARPVMCRKHHSPSVSWCNLQNPNIEVQRPEVYEITVTLAPVIIAVANILKKEGFDSKPYDLSCALDEAFCNPACFKRWRAGKNAFSKDIVAKDWNEADCATVPPLPPDDSKPYKYRSGTNTTKSC